MAKKTKPEAAPAPAAKVAKQVAAEPPAVPAKAAAAPAQARAPAAANGAATKQQQKKGKATNQSQSGGAAGAAANKAPAATAEQELKETVDGMALGKRLADNGTFQKSRALVSPRAHAQGGAVWCAQTSTSVIRFVHAGLLPHSCRSLHECLGLQSVAVVRRWLAVHPEANESDYKKLWKALFYCMWSGTHDVCGATQCPAAQACGCQTRCPFSRSWLRRLQSWYAPEFGDVSSTHVLLAGADDGIAANASCLVFPCVCADHAARVERA